MGHFCNETYLFSFLLQILSPQSFPSGSAQGLRREARTEGMSQSFSLPDSGYRETLQVSTVHQEACFSKVEWSHLWWSYPSYPLWEATVVSNIQQKSCPKGTGQLCQLIFALFGFHSLQRHVVNRIYTLHILSNL